jgi:ABC-type dipeptide/oligopeptide/nickel transport system permease subunit
MELTIITYLTDVLMLTPTLLVAIVLVEIFGLIILGQTQVMVLAILILLLGTFQVTALETL